MINLTWSANIGFEIFYSSYSINKLEFACEAIKEIVKDKRNFDKVTITLNVEVPITLKVIFGIPLLQEIIIII